MDMELGVDERMPILKKNRMATGIPDLDLIMEGGYFNPGNILFVGPSGIEKAAFSYHFVATTATDENAYIICGNSSPDSIINKASSIGVNLNKENIRFIDCYTATLGKGDTKSTEKIMVMDGPTALNDISLALNEAIRASSGKKMRVVFDTLSTFILYNSKDSMRKFLSVIAGRLRNAGATTLYLVDEGVHDKPLLSLMEQGMDETYNLVDREGKFFLVLSEINVDVPIKVGPGGIGVR